MGYEERGKKLQAQAVEEALKEWKEANPTLELKICFVSNTTLIGKYEEGILSSPRAITLGVDPQGRQILMLHKLIGDPEIVEVVNPSVMYDVRDESLINLYIKATTNIDLAKDLSNLPLGPGMS